MRPQIFGQDADILASHAGTTGDTVQERRRPYKLGGLGAHFRANEHKTAENALSQMLLKLIIDRAESVMVFFAILRYTKNQITCYLDHARVA
jgi:hypothetical protein